MQKNNSTKLDKQAMKNKFQKDFFQKKKKKNQIEILRMNSLVSYTLKIT